MTRSKLVFSLCVGVAALAAITPDSAEAKSRRLAPSAISDDVVITDGDVLLPLVDVVAAIGCTVKPGKPESRAYEAWPCRPGALFELDVEALAAYVPTTPGAKKGFDPQPEPPRVLKIGEHVASRIVIIQSGDPHIPLSEVAALLGGRVKRSGKKAWISVPEDAKAPLQLAAK